jgi:hypothetical protein
MVDEIRTGSGDFATSAQVRTALEAVFRGIQHPLGIADAHEEGLVRFIPDGGSLPSLLRSLSPTVDFGDGTGQIPLRRHGSTSEALLAAGEALAAMRNSPGVVVVDDFGEGMDAASAKFAALALRASATQGWVSTRRPSVAEAFRASEILRLTRGPNAARSAFQGREPETKAERIAARHRALQLLPAIAARTLVIVEGPHDRAAYEAIADRLFAEQGTAPPAAHSIHLIDAAAADSSGGSSATPRLAQAARELGFRVVNVIDHDGDDAKVAAELEANLAAADVVIRLPPHFAIERALVSGIDEPILRAVLIDLRAAFDLHQDPHQDLHAAHGAELVQLAIRMLKSSGGLHAEFVEALPAGCIPDVGRRVLESLVGAALGQADGHVQL